MDSSFWQLINTIVKTPLKWVQWLYPEHQEKKIDEYHDLKEFEDTKKASALFLHVNLPELRFFYNKIILRKDRYLALKKKFGKILPEQENKIMLEIIDLNNELFGIFLNVVKHYKILESLGYFDPESENFTKSHQARKRFIVEIRELLFFINQSTSMREICKYNYKSVDDLIEWEREALLTLKTELKIYINTTKRTGPH